MKLSPSDFFMIVGCFLNFFIGIIFLFIKGKNNTSNKLLGFLLLAFSTYLIPSFLDRFGLLEVLPHLIRIHLFVGLLIGPLIYYYVRSATIKDFQFQKSDFAHFVPFFVDFVYNLPFLIQNGAAKLEFYHGVRSGEIDLAFDLLIIARAVHALIYFGFSVYVIQQYRKHLPNEVSSIDHNFHRWLLFFSGALLIPLLSIGVYVFSGYEISVQVFIVFGFFALSVAVILGALLKPALFHEFPGPVPQNTNLTQGKEKYKTSNLQEVQKDKYLKKILTYFEEEKPYREPELTLTELGERLKISANYLSQVINEKLERNFLDFVNQYRINEAKHLLLDKNNSHLTILAIAFEVGFNSKTAFYTAFKKDTNSTPTQYRKSANASA